MKRYQRGLAGLLAAVMLTSAVPFASAAETGSDVPEAAASLTVEAAQGAYRHEANVTVTDQDGSPVSGAQLCLDGEPVGVTDENGTYDGAELNEVVGRFTLTAELGEITSADASYYVARSEFPSQVAVSCGQDASTEMMFSWHTDTDTEATIVEYYAEGEADSFDGALQVEGGSHPFTFYDYVGDRKDPNNTIHERYEGNVHRASVTGLEADTRYHYRVGDGTHWTEGTFETAPDETGSFKFFYFVDTQQSTRAGFQSDFGGTLAYAREHTEDVDFLLTVGDLVEWGVNGQEYEWWFEQAQDTLLTMPVETVMGNHETNGVDFDGGQYDNYFYNEYFHNPSNGTQCPIENSLYSFDYGNAHFVGLDLMTLETFFAENAEGKTENFEAAMNWLISDLAGVEDGMFKIVFMHDGLYGADRDNYESREVLAPIFEEYGVQLVLAGHDHMYVRTLPIQYEKFDEIYGYENYPDAVIAPDGEAGTTYVIGGSVCGKHYTQTFTRPYHAVVMPSDFEGITSEDLYENTRWQSLTTQNFSTVEVTPDQIHLISQDRDGNVIDEFALDLNGRLVPMEAPSDALVSGEENGEADLDVTKIAGYSAGQFDVDGGVMEIVAYNQTNGCAYAVNGKSGQLAMIPMDDLSSGSTVAALEGKNFDVKAAVEAADPTFSYGDMTSVAVSPDGSRLAAALQAEGYADAGRVALFTCQADGSLTFEKLVTVGVQPDMVVWADNGTVLTADEGEPREGYDGAVDPKGSVSIVDAAAGTAVVATFDSFDARREALVSDGIILKSGSNPSADLEPEYIAVAGGKAYVTLQENNAIAVLDLASRTFTGVYSAGFEDYSVTPVDMDKEDEQYAPKTYDGLLGIRMPDGIAAFQQDGQTYLVTANEGDSREWGDYLNENEAKKEAASPAGNIHEGQVGGKVVYFGEESKDESAKGYDGLDKTKDYLFGGRSFTVYAVTDTGIREVFTSGDDFEALTAQYLPDYFNASNDNAELDSRSGKKGPEAESVTVGQVDGKTYAFIALERTGGVMVYDVTDPANASYVNYINSRDFTTTVPGSEKYEEGELDKWVTGGDVAPEGFAFVSASHSATGEALLLTACEVSGTVAVYELEARGSSGGSTGGGSGSKPAEKPDETTDGQEDAFLDVSAGAYYAEAVAWAVEEGITSGISDTAFGPDLACTRAQMVTFLWRAAGSPAPKSTDNPFTDVADDAYYYEAVLWAAEEGITSGTSKTTFAPDATVSRGQTVTFLYRAAGSPAVSGSSFGDVSADAYYAGAVAWAAEEGITSGTGADTFGPAQPCTRAQIVTFLYRDRA